MPFTPALFADMRVAMPCATRFRYAMATLPLPWPRHFTALLCRHLRRHAAFRHAYYAIYFAPDYLPIV